MSLSFVERVKNFIVPGQRNNFHPMSVRTISIFGYTFIFLLLNYFIFPVAGITRNRVFAADISPQSILELTNQERKSQGLPELRENSMLSTAAFFKGTDMIEKQYWSHFGPNGETPWQFIVNSGYTYSYAGENLAKDFESSTGVVQAWMQSETHRENLLNSKFTDIGIAILNGRLDGEETTLIVQMFATQNDIEIDHNNKINNVQPSQTELVAPQLFAPQDGLTTNSNQVFIQGYSIEGNTIKVYSNDKVLGELPNKNAAFSGEIFIYEEHSSLFVKAIDTASGRTSLPSNIVSVKLDQFIPQWSSSNLFFNFSQEKGTILLTSSEELKEVSASINGKNYFFSNENKVYFLHLNKDIIKGNIKIIITDIAGNMNEQNLKINKASISTIKSSSILTSSPTVINSLSYDDNSSLSHVTSVQKYNLAFLGVIFFFVFIDLVFMLKKGIKREQSSHYSLNTGILVLLIIGSLLI